ncbi:DUF6878 family protein [Azospirillum sp. INR13]|uniref:DUF6878 family protein n=1 Tax=Azospirillum sp. INR13 TaxID=2596919 RepID=UPI00351C80C1
MAIPARSRPSTPRPAKPRCRYPTAPPRSSPPLWDGSALERRPLPLGEAVEALTYDLLTATHDGWEDGDGAFGVLVLDVSGRAVRLEYNERYTASDYYEHDF